MLTSLRRIAAQAAGNRPHDDRRSASLHAPLVAVLERDLANLDNLTRALSWPRRSGGRRAD